MKITMVVGSLEGTYFPINCLSKYYKLSQDPSLNYPTNFLIFIHVTNKDFLVKTYPLKSGIFSLFLTNCTDFTFSPFTLNNSYITFSLFSLHSETIISVTPGNFKRIGQIVHISSTLNLVPSINLSKMP